MPSLRTPTSGGAPRARDEGGALEPVTARGLGLLSAVWQPPGHGVAVYRLPAAGPGVRRGRDRPEGRCWTRGRGPSGCGTRQQPRWVSPVPVAASSKGGAPAGSQAGSLVEFGMVFLLLYKVVFCIPADLASFLSDLKY